MCQSFFWAFLARARVAASRRRPAGAIPARTGSWDTGFRHPATIRRALLMATSTFVTCGLLLQAGVQYLAAEKTRACVDIHSSPGRTGDTSDERDP